jgi:hypothetical protein
VLSFKVTRACLIMTLDPMSSDGRQETPHTDLQHQVSDV